MDVFQSINNDGKIFNAASRVGFQVMSVDKAMTKSVKLLIAIILFLFVILISVATYNLINIGSMLSAINTDSESGYNSQSKEQVFPAGFIREQKSTDTDTENRLPGHYETIEETIARIKKDVIVTGTVTGLPGEETAFFQIEGMADRAFLINTQLMDGFIIKEITETHVILKNQIGEETFILNVQA